MIGKGSEYAIRALISIEMKNREGLRPGYRETAREIEAPEQYTAKILQTLGHAGILSSVRGRGGGFFLAKDPAEVSLLEVIRLIEGDGFFSRCGIGLKDCNDASPCPLHDKYAFIRDSYFKLVSSETIKSLSDKIRRGDAVLNRLS